MVWELKMESFTNSLKRRPSRTFRQKPTASSSLLVPLPTSHHPEPAPLCPQWPARATLSGIYHIMATSRVPFSLSHEPAGSWEQKPRVGKPYDQSTQHATWHSKHRPIKADKRGSKAERWRCQCWNQRSEFSRSTNHMPGCRTRRQKACHWSWHEYFPSPCVQTEGREL